MTTIAEKMKNQIAKKHGISSSDIAELVSQQKPVAPQPEKKDEDPVGFKMTEPSVVQQEKPEANDKLMSAAAVEQADDKFFFGVAGIDPSKNTVEVTSADKNAFVDAVLSGDRMKMRYSLFGGRFSFTIKNRTYEEARAALTMASNKSVMDELRSLFSLRLRLMLMALQIDELNGVSYPDADTLGPLMPVYVDKKLVQPAWLDRLGIIGKLPEAVFEAIWQCLYEFELKYWTLVRHSRDQDFWLPE